jgi:hypothetical protein
MKVVISGSRTYANKDIVYTALKNSGYNITELISGHANGVDKLGEQWAREHNIPVTLFAPQYDLHESKIAPLIRNEQMADYGDALIAVWYNKSHGTAHMIKCMKDLNKPTIVIEIND